ncbi:MAG TPA: hypothetical protein VFZ66_28045 [Herpetosiphonaceae bacterium]
MERLDREPQDKEFFSLFVTAVKDGVEIVRTLEANKKYIGSHFDWPTISYTENGMPSFSQTIFSGTTNYGEPFRKGSSATVDYTTIPSFMMLINYLKSKDEFYKHLGVPEHAMIAGINFFEISAVMLITNTIDRYMHLYRDDPFSESLILPMYLLIENSIFHNDLNINILIPILLLNFDSDNIQFDNGFSIVRMTDDFQLARVLNRGLALGIHHFVSDSATHAFVIKNWHIKNNGFWDVTNGLSNIANYPIHHIDTFFAALRIVTGLYTGYAQILSQPIDWAFRFTAYLPPVHGITTRSYPKWFDEGHWRSTLPIVTYQQAIEIGNIFSKLLNMNVNEVGIAARRLNMCLSRDNEEDSILDATIAMETLLSDDERQEMTHKLALRMAAISRLLPDQEFTPLEIYQIVKHIYAYRSAIVHGSSKATKKREFTFRDNKKISTVKVAVELLRMALKILLLNPEYLKPVKIDEELLLGSFTN